MFNSERLKRLRKELGLSQMEMSEKLFVPQSTYSKYETNKIDLNITLLQRIHEKFGIHPCELILINGDCDNLKREGNIIGLKNYYVFPADVVEAIVSTQQSILTMLRGIVDSTQ